MVGAGKTTLTQALSTHYGFRPALESVDDENPWLTRFYSEPDGVKTYALNLQLHFLATRMESLRKMREIGGGWILDRTWYEDAEIFARGHFEDGNISPTEFDLYQRLYTEIKHLPAATPPDLMVFIDGPIDVILDRIQRRGREAERDMDPGYWHKLHRRYRNWHRTFDACPVLTLDIREYDLQRDPDAIHSISERIELQLGYNPQERVLSPAPNPLRRTSS